MMQKRLFPTHHGKQWWDISLRPVGENVAELTPKKVQDIFFNKKHPTL